MVVYDFENTSLKWNENDLGSMNMHFQIDQILLPLLITYRPGYMLICGDRENSLLSEIKKISPERMARMGFC